MTHPAPSGSPLPDITGNAFCSPDDSRRSAASAARDVIEKETVGLNALAEAMLDASGLGGQFSKVVEVIASLEGRVVVTGIGKSGHIGRKIQATLSSTGTPALFVHPVEASHGDLGMLARGDAVLILSNSGESAELADMVAHSLRFGLPLIAVTARPESSLGRAADHVLLLPAVPEACPVGLAPTTSSLMQLSLGDALAVALMERRGFTAGDFGVFHPGGRLGARLRTVRELMRTGDALPFVTPEASLRDAIMEMTRKALGCVGVVGKDGQLSGIITDGDLRGALDRDLNATPSGAVMNRAPLTVAPDILAAEALRLMNERDKPITSLFVLTPERQVVGVVHVHDLLRAGVA
ncbi:arabinose-5-phosphate isomerase GutQ [Acetobacter nitrogenifigens DSM 23921 = NBRC 105050]|uniref:KpsF/GutQ family protein n=1 Tax=Acetobacter nitrogenifigens DSM 23921 = NBRC 105050 TaxID=1120919 RepID=A0A511X6P2_9PROT|nr:KpsF/GutQ family sugar-phosphate isomerase [Acetobacter nitrogenifigens]GBQ98871.1 arabinose-5-phosphate isomerase GutQ [Acetobacter nitrogenifigens DSM 23921 = NBRC 105050]GEN58623.1 KpsF/GutQ family protein [Acetobacter nitrogenifigens DSM 23921 = NBRC 105050]